MTKLVFVHGVATRHSNEYEARSSNRDLLFKKMVFGDSLTVSSPMWGHFVPKIAAEVFETDSTTRAFALGGRNNAGLGGGLGGNAAPLPGAPDVSIVKLGEQDPVAALDAIGSAIYDRAESEGRTLSEEELHAFSAAVELIEKGQAASAFPKAGTEQHLVQALTQGGPAAFGVAGKVPAAIKALTDRIRNAFSGVVYGAIREKLGPAVGLFFGDVFVYLRDGATREKIRAEVSKSLRDAYSAARTEKVPLVVVGHSLGGVILVDMLSDPVAAGLPADIQVDFLFTVGSQPGLFGALGTLAGSDVGGGKRIRPKCVTHWINVFDPIDPFAFRADPVFGGVTDLSFNSVTGITEAHSAYFQRPQFYARMRAQLRDAGVLKG